MIARPGNTIIFPEQSLPAGRMVGLGIQHVIAMFGATVLAPFLMGFDPNLAIFFSGIGTLIFMAVVRAGSRVTSAVPLRSSDRLSPPRATAVSRRPWAELRRRPWCTSWWARWSRPGPERGPSRR